MAVSLGSRVQERDAHFQGVLPGEALVAMIAREWLDRKMDPFVSFQVVISVKALWALVTSKWSFIR